MNLGAPRPADGSDRASHDKVPQALLIRQRLDRATAAVEVERADLLGGEGTCIPPHFLVFRIGEGVLRAGCSSLIFHSAGWSTMSRTSPSSVLGPRLTSASRPGAKSGWSSIRRRARRAVHYRDRFQLQPLNEGLQSSMSPTSPVATTAPRVNRPRVGIPRGRHRRSSIRRRIATAPEVRFTDRDPLTLGRVHERRSFGIRSEREGRQSPEPLTASPQMLRTGPVASSPFIFLVVFDSSCLFAPCRAGPA